jgi:hypothetical protein
LELRRTGESIVTYRFFHHSLHYYTGYQIAKELDDTKSLRQFVRTHPSSLIVTDSEGLKEISDSKGLSIALLGKQGNCCLLRISQER